MRLQHPLCLPDGILIALPVDDDWPLHLRCSSRVSARAQAQDMNSKYLQNTHASSTAFNATSC